MLVKVETADRLPVPSMPYSSLNSL